MLQGLKQEISAIQHLKYFGFVRTIIGGLVHVAGLNQHIAVGSVCQIENRKGNVFPAEVVGFNQEVTLVMGYAPLDDVGPGCKVTFAGKSNVIYPHQSWLGRVLNGFAVEIDQKGSLPRGPQPYALTALPPAAHSRRLVEKRIDLGIRALNTFVTCCSGQRMGIFAGSGVGKSVLLAMLAQFSKADIIVIGLIGERGREVKEFLDKHLGPKGMDRCVVVVATSDEPALMRRRAAYTTLSIAEYFRDQGHEVLCLIDSVTRFAMALREIGLAIGEPPTTKGYTPNVFVELTRLLERAGPGLERLLSSGQIQGNITGLFTVLVEGDDHNEPISDAVRGILDGHIVLERKIAERGRFPAVNILRSISRTMPDCNTNEETDLITKARQYLSTYDEMEELIRLGAYRKGANPTVDAAINYFDTLDHFIAQSKDERISLQEGFDHLELILNHKPEGSTYV